jgi:hypothetical protein
MHSNSLNFFLFSYGYTIFIFLFYRISTHGFRFSNDAVFQYFQRPGNPSSLGIPVSFSHSNPSHSSVRFGNPSPSVHTITIPRIKEYLVYSNSYVFIPTTFVSFLFSKTKTILSSFPPFFYSFIQ